MATAGVFAHIKGLDQIEFERNFEKKILQDGQTLSAFGAKEDSMFVILSGRIEVQRPKRKEGEFEVAANLEAGQVTGESSYVGNYERNATLIARGATEVLVITKGGVGKLKGSRPDIVIAFYEGVLQQVTERFRTVSNKKDTLSFWL